MGLAYIFGNNIAFCLLYKQLKIQVFMKII